MSLQFVPSIALGEGPVHGFAVEIASVSPRQPFVTERVEGRETSVKTRRRTCRELACSPMEPGAFFGCLVRIKPLTQLEGITGRSHCITRARGMGIEVVLHQTHTLDRRVMLVQQVVPKRRIINGGASCFDVHGAQTRMRFTSQEDATCSMLFLGIMLALRFARTHGQDRADIAKKKARTRIKTHQRSYRGIR